MGNWSPFCCGCSPGDDNCCTETCCRTIVDCPSTLPFEFEVDMVGVYSTSNNSYGCNCKWDVSYSGSGSFLWNSCGYVNSPDRGWYDCRGDTTESRPCAANDGRESSRKLLFTDVSMTATPSDDGGGTCEDDTMSGSGYDPVVYGPCEILLRRQCYGQYGCGDEWGYQCWIPDCEGCKDCRSFFQGIHQEDCREVYSVNNASCDPEWGVAEFICERKSGIVGNPVCVDRDQWLNIDIRSHGKCLPTGDPYAEGDCYRDYQPNTPPYCGTVASSCSTSPCDEDSGGRGCGGCNGCAKKEVSDTSNECSECAAQDCQGFCGMPGVFATFKLEMSHTWPEHSNECFAGTYPLVGVTAVPLVGSNWSVTSSTGSATIG